MKKLVLLVILIVLLTIFLSADIYMKSMERTQAFEIMGNKQPEKVEIKETWLAENKFANYGKEHTLILNMDKGTIYFILHKEKIYIELPTDITKEKLLNYLANINPKAAEIAKSIKITDAKVNISKDIAVYNKKGVIDVLFSILDRPGGAQWSRFNAVN